MCSHDVHTPLSVACCYVAFCPAYWDARDVDTKHHRLLGLRFLTEAFDPKTLSYKHLLREVQT